MEKTFDKDFNQFLSKLEANKHFAITRFGDGEMMLMGKKYVDLMNKGVGEFRYDGSSQYDKSIRMLEDSFTFFDPNYYVGVGCPCCVGKDKADEMKKSSGLSCETLTWANIFVNSNYPYTLDKILPLFKEKENSIVLVAHEKSDIRKLPWTQDPGRFYPVRSNAWLENLNLIEDLADRDYQDSIFVVCAGPFANILIHQLFKKNKNNTYLDFGSALDPQLGLPVTRGYQLGADTLRRVCTWE